MHAMHNLSGGNAKELHPTKRYFDMLQAFKISYDMIEVVSHPNQDLNSIVNRNLKL